jgi:hypothetical protein
MATLPAQFGYPDPARITATTKAGAPRKIGQTSGNTGDSSVSFSSPGDSRAMIAPRSI